MRKLVLFLLCCVGLVSCDYFNQGTEPTAVARVNDNYLLVEDLKGLVSEGMSAEDSTLIVNNFIKRWATKQLLIDQAKINLSENRLDEFEKLVSQYKNDLYTEAYKSAIVSRQLDSTISNFEYENFYEQKKENFKLNDELMKVRYIHLGENYSNLASIKEKFSRFNSEDKQQLNNLNIQFKNSNFNDSIWVEKEALLRLLPIVAANSDQVLKKSNFTQLQDSLGVYLVKIEDLLKPNDIAPLSYIKPTITQIILNRRKLELIKKLEKDITKDAIKNKDFEIYKPK